MHATARARPRIRLTFEPMTALLLLASVLLLGALGLRVMKIRTAPPSPLVGQFVARASEPRWALTLDADGGVWLRQTVQNFTTTTLGRYTTDGDTAFITFDALRRQGVSAVGVRTGDVLTVRMRVAGRDGAPVTLERER